MRKFGDPDSLMTLDTNDTNDTHFCQRNQEKCSKSRLVTTSAIKHFIAKVDEFYPKSGVVLPWRTYNVVETRRQGDKETRSSRSSRSSEAHKTYLVPRISNFFSTKKIF